MKLQFHHFALTVENIEKSIQWYERIFDFSVVKKYEGNGMQIALLTCGECRLELFHFVEKTKPLPKYRKEVMSDLAVVGAKHVCFEVDNIEKSIGELKQRGVEIASETDTTFFGGRYVFVRDCNGILIELYEKGEVI